MAHSIPPPLLDDARCAFLLGPVSINAAGRDAAQIPSVSRALGCRVSADRREVTVLLAAARAGELIADYQANGAIAVVFSRPSTHETLQLKGSDARVEPPAPGDRELIAAYREALASELASLGYGRDFAMTLTAFGDDPLVAVRFTPTVVFLQTPGPGAGRRLER